MLKKLSTKVSLALIAVMAAVTGVFTWYLVRDLTRQANAVILEKGIASAQTGATIMSGTLDHIIDNGLFSVDEVFDSTLTPSIRTRNRTPGKSRSNCPPSHRARRHSITARPAAFPRYRHQGETGPNPSRT